MALTPLKFTTRRGTTPVTMPWSATAADQLLAMAQGSGGGSYVSKVATLQEVQTLVNQAFTAVDALTGQNTGRMVYVSDGLGSGAPSLAVFTSATDFMVVGPNHYDIAFFYGGTPPSAGEVLQKIMVVRDIQFPSDFSGSSGDVGTNPDASYAITIARNGVTIGTVTIATNGTFTFATEGSGAAQTVNKGQYLEFIAPTGSPAEASLADVALTLAAEEIMVGA